MTLCTYSVIRCFSILLLLTMCETSQNDDPNSPAFDSPQNETEVRVRRLVEGLVSPNPPPRRGLKNNLVFPKEWSQEKQEPVYRSMLELLKMGPVALPELGRHLGDTRYCCSVQGPSAEDNLDVGDACQAIFDSWGSPQFHGLWAKNKSKPLYEIQALFLEENIELIKSWNLEEKASRRGLSVTAVKEEQTEALSQLRRQVETLRSSKTPKKPASIGLQVIFPGGRKGI